MLAVGDVVLVVDGTVHVTESQDAADAVITATEEVLLQLVRGDQNLTTAVLSGRIEVAGDLAAGERFARALFGR